jgi:hypothetical protein
MYFPYDSRRVTSGRAVFVTEKCASIGQENFVSASIPNTI